MQRRHRPKGLEDASWVWATKKRSLATRFFCPHEATASESIEVLAKLKAETHPDICMSGLSDLEANKVASVSFPPEADEGPGDSGPLPSEYNAPDPSFCPSGDYVGQGTNLDRSPKSQVLAYADRGLSSDEPVPRERLEKDKLQQGCISLMLHVNRGEEFKGESKEDSKEDSTLELSGRIDTGLEEGSKDSNPSGIKQGGTQTQVIQPNCQASTDSSSISKREDFLIPIKADDLTEESTVTYSDPSINSSTEVASNEESSSLKKSRKR